MKWFILANFLTTVYLNTRTLRDGLKEIEESFFRKFKKLISKCGNYKSLSTKDLKRQWSTKIALKMKNPIMLEMGDTSLNLKNGRYPYQEQIFHGKFVVSRITTAVIATQCSSKWFRTRKPSWKKSSPKDICQSMSSSKRESISIRKSFKIRQ